MGILDDLAMGFGLKERTEDYDARTARTLALQEQYDNDADRLRARASGDYDVTSGRAAQYLGSRGRENYSPQILDDNRPFMQRLLFSQESDLISPTPRGFAGPIGLFMNILSGGQRNVPTVSADTSPMRVRPQSGYNLGGNAQSGTRFDTRTEAEPIDYSDSIPVEDPATIAAVEALNSVPDVPTLPSAPSILADPTGELSSMNNVDPLRPKDIGVDKYGRRTSPKMPSDPTYYSGIETAFPNLAVPAGLMSTMPTMLEGTEIAQVYSGYLASGGTKDFDEFTRGMR